MRPFADLARAIETGRVKALWAMGAEVARRRDSPGAREARRRSCARLSTTARWRTPRRCSCRRRRTAETDGTFVNFEGRPQRFELAYWPRGGAQPHWKLAAELGKALGLAWRFHTAREVLTELGPRVAEAVPGVRLGRASPRGPGGAVSSRSPRGRWTDGFRDTASASRAMPRATRGWTFCESGGKGDTCGDFSAWCCSRSLYRCRWCCWPTACTGSWASSSTSPRGYGLPATYGAAIANVLVLMAGVVMTTAAALTVGERKWSAMIQNRIGPNRIKVFGQSVGGIFFLAADALKMLTKENIEPDKRSRVLYELAPMARLRALVRPLRGGPGRAAGRTSRSAGLVHRIALQVANIDAGLLFVFGVASLAVYGTSLAGWASNNKLALLGGVRASSQMISYEVSLGLSLVGIDDGLPVAAPRGDGRGAGPVCCWGMPAGLGLFLQPVGLPRLLRVRLRRDEARALRPAGGRERDRRLLRRVPGHEVRHDVPGRVHRGGGARRASPPPSSSAAGTRSSSSRP